MDIRSIISPKIVNESSLLEFAESLDDLAPLVESDIAKLKESPNDRALIGSLFRAIHNIKGDGALCKVELAVAITHPIETLLARIREGEVPFTPLLAETVLLAIDRLELAIESLVQHQPLENLRLLSLIQGLEKIALAPTSDLPQSATKIITTVTGFPPSAKHPDTFFSENESASQQTSSDSDIKSDSRDDDLRFFRSLADQLEAKSVLFKGRTQRLLRLALETNRERGNLVDPQQLEAAVYLHDLGMMFLPEAAWLKPSSMTTSEKFALRRHPVYAHGIISRMNGWMAASQMVAQHHEMPDGQGYPDGLTENNIVPGAQILAIIDAFEAIMLKHIHRGRNRSVLRAIAEINACNNQFASAWIEPFNTVIRRHLDT